MNRATVVLRKNKLSGEVARQQLGVVPVVRKGAP